MQHLTCTCGTVLEVTPEMAGRQVYCPHCNTIVVSPNAAAPAPAVQPVTPQIVEPSASNAAPGPARPAPRKTNTGLWIGLGVGGLLLVMLVCGGLISLIVYSVETARAKRVVLKSNDGWTQVTVPGNITKQFGMDAQANIQAGNAFDDLWLLTVSEHKSQLPRHLHDLESYRDVVLDIVTEEHQKKRIGSWQKLTINGHPALQTEIHSRVTGIDAAFLYTVYESDQGFHQVTIWTTERRFGGHRKAMVEMAESFKANR